MRTFLVVLNLIKKTCSDFRFMIIKDPFSMFLSEGQLRLNYLNFVMGTHLPLQKVQSA